ncbi:circularly permuted type 2 ATP-grasp protein [Verrucomicrobiota bacterium sgz303538]
MTETSTPLRRLPRATLARRRHEILDLAGQPRSAYRRPLERLQGYRRAQLRELDEHMEATIREMGVHYGSSHTGAQKAWACDLLPHVFSTEEWERVVAGVRQRVRAFELFLQDVYGPRRILRDGVVPTHLVLGSPLYQGASINLPLPKDAYLHLCGVCLTRDRNGALAVKGHQLSRASGIAYMMQNRRALARVLPELFEENTVSSLADTPIALSDALRNAAPAKIDSPSVVLLSPGPESAAYYAHGFLARRTGISLVRGDDLLVLEDHLYLKTVRGLKRVDVIYNRVPDAWLDPLVLRKGSHLGVPGLVHCLRRGTVTLLNAIGSELADNRSLLHFAPTIIRYYLHESPILPTIPTYWLGDIDQREMVLGDIGNFRIEPISGDEFTSALELPPEQLARMIRKEPGHYVAQRVDPEAVTLYYNDGQLAEGRQEHLVFALRQDQDYEIFPGSLSIVHPTQTGAGDHWITKDSWVPGGDIAHPSIHVRPRRFMESHAPSREVTSRVAESFYWMGRYLERAYHQAYMIQAIETLETEELNSAERKLYQPMWNRLLPPLEKSAGVSRRSITTRLDRYRLTLLPEPGSVASAFKRVISNAESVQESLSPEAWATLSSLRTLFQRTKFKSKISDAECARVALRLTAEVTQGIPQFYAIASRTMLGDDGWRFCEIGEKLERAMITANAVYSIGKALGRTPQATEIQLSAFLRLLGTRDAYRRVFQMRAEPAAVLEVLWQHPEAPHSVLRCLSSCMELLRESASSNSSGATTALSGIDDLIHKIRRIDWHAYLPVEHEDPSPTEARSREPQKDALSPLLSKLLGSTLDVHQLISDGFLSHQAYIAQTVQPLLQGFRNGI